MGASATTGIALYIQGGVPKVWNGSLVLTSSQSVVGFTWYHLALVRSSGTLTMYLNGTSVGSVSFTSNLTGGELSSGPSIGTWSPVDLSYFPGYISNFRIVKGTAIVPPAGGPTSPLTAVSGTSLLTCQSNRFRDASSNNFAATVSGSPSVQAFSPFNPTSSWSAVTNGGSGYFDGTGDYLATPSNSALAVGAGDFCIETWIYWGTSSVNDVIYSNVLNSGGGDAQIEIYINSSNKVVCGGWNTNFLVGSTNVTSNAWTHIAVCRSGTTMSLFLNGTRDATTTTANNFSSTNAFNVGRQASGAYDFLGYISNLRVVKGSSVYDPTQPTLTVPTAPLTAITNTSLLLNFTNAGIYDATSKNDLETVGNAQISTAQSKFGGSSMAFDGTGDYLLSPDQPIQRIGTGNFTIECWVYRNSSGTYGLVGKGTGTTGWLLSLNSSNQVVFTYGSSTITSTGTVSATTWTYIAVVREGTGTNQTKIYINGSNDGTGTVSTDFNQTNSLYVGADRTGGSNANVYLQDLRISNYARTITASPTAAFPTL